MTTITERALLEQAEGALEIAKNGLLWYQDAFPDVGSECDNEAIEEIDTSLGALRAALAAQPSGPAWHDAPNEPGIWICDEGDICYEWTAHSIEILDQFDPGDGYRWFGPIPEDTK